MEEKFCLVVALRAALMLGKNYPLVSCKACPPQLPSDIFFGLHALLSAIAFSNLHHCLKKILNWRRRVNYHFPTIVQMLLSSTTTSELVNVNSPCLLSKRPAHLSAVESYGSEPRQVFVSGLWWHSGQPFLHDHSESPTIDEPYRDYRPNET